MNRFVIVCLLLVGGALAVGHDDAVVVFKRPFISTLLPEDSLIRQYSEQGSLLNSIPGLSTEPGLDQIEHFLATSERLPGMSSIMLRIVFLLYDRQQVQRLVNDTVPAVYFNQKKTEGDLLLEALYSIRRPTAGDDRIARLRSPKN